VLAWLHAALSDEVVKQGKPATKPTVKQTQAPVNQVQPTVKQTVALTEVVKLTDGKIAELAGVSRQSVNGWRKDGKLEAKLMERLPSLATIHVNGHNAQ
jgi:hypothetical protein